MKCLFRSIGIVLQSFYYFRGDVVILYVRLYKNKVKYFISFVFTSFALFLLYWKRSVDFHTAIVFYALLFLFTKTRRLNRNSSKTKQKLTKRYIISVCDSYAALNLRFCLLCLYASMYKSFIGRSSIFSLNFPFRYSYIWFARHSNLHNLIFFILRRETMAHTEIFMRISAVNIKTVFIFLPIFFFVSLTKCREDDRKMAKEEMANKNIKTATYARSHEKLNAIMIISAPYRQQNIYSTSRCIICAPFKWVIKAIYIFYVSF